MDHAVRPIARGGEEQQRKDEDGDVTGDARSDIETKQVIDLARPVNTH